MSFHFARCSNTLASVTVFTVGRVARTISRICAVAAVVAGAGTALTYAQPALESTPSVSFPVLPAQPAQLSQLPQPAPTTPVEQPALAGLPAKAFTLSPIAKWVEDVTPAFAPTPQKDVTYGYDYQLIDRQINVSASAEFEHYIYRITSENAVQSAGSISISFDPAYEKLALHHVRVIRDKKTQNRLTEASVKILQQERDLDRYMLNGRLTALVVLDDIRAGDVIDYALTRTGSNPVFENHYMDFFSSGWSIPVRHQHLRIITPASRALNHRSLLQKSLGLNRERSGDDLVYTWTGTNLPPISSDGDVPSWFTPFPSIQVTDFADWSAVNEWALPLYSVPNPVPAKIIAKARELTNGISDREAQAIALLQFVQQEIRYLGLELGPGSHRPTPPVEVLERRFGDCKDKTLLFCSLMRAVGQDAYPALLNTSFRDRIGEWLPSPYAFDHVIACIPRGDGFWWVDPTLTDQKGGALHRGLPDYRLALVVRKGTDKLTPIDRPVEAGRHIKIEERFDIKSLKQPAEFKVTSRYTGLSADTVRSYLADTTLAQISKDYINHYTSPYPGLTATKDVSWVDDAATNTVTVEENYSVPGLWKDGEEGRMKAEFYPETISDYVTQPTTRVRTMPLRVAHPFKIELTTRVNLPADWKITPEESTITSPAFRAHDKISLDGRTVTMAYEWTSLADFVPAEKIQEHITAVQKTRGGLGYELSYDKALADGVAEKTRGKNEAETDEDPFRFNWLLIVVMMTTGIVLYPISRWILTRRGLVPPPIPSFGESELIGLGGWLGLVGFVLIIRPLIFTYQFIDGFKWAFDLTRWEILTTPGSNIYSPATTAVILIEVAFNTALIWFAVLLILLFFRRKKTFTPTLMYFTAGVFAFHLFDLIAANALGNGDVQGESKLSDIATNGIQLIVWIPYLLMSRRVKLTFTR